MLINIKRTLLKCPVLREDLLVYLQVSAWGGYVFIINLIPLHVFVLLLMGRYSHRIFVGKYRMCCCCIIGIDYNHVDVGLSVHLIILWR